MKKQKQNKKLTNYRFIANVTISLYTEVQAETLEEARNIAYDRNLTDIIDQGNEQIEWVTSGELDGEVQDIVLQ